MPYDYGRCHACGGAVEERLTDQTVQQAGEWLLIKEVPTGVCTRCGEQIFRGKVLERLEEIRMRTGRQQPDSHIQVPVFAF